MRDKNLYTITLCTVGILCILYLIIQRDTIVLLELVPILFLILLLDFFPVKMLSGGEYSGGIVGFLVILILFGLENAVLGIWISTCVFYAKRSNWRILRINYFRLFTTVGMYAVSILLTDLMITSFDGSSIFILTGMGALTFEVVNILLMAGIYATVGGSPFFGNVWFKIKEILLPVVLCAVIVPHFIHHDSYPEILMETGYTLLFLLIIIYFSNQFLRQATLRKKSAEEFITLCEAKVSNQAEGHGARVGMIASDLLEIISYPKRKRRELIMAVILHDIGKGLIPAHVLNKRGALSISEEKEYQSHSEKSAGIVRNITGNEQIYKWVLYHHERFDGKGFPDKLKGTDIPYESRIISLCNHLDHLIQKYSNDESVFEVLQELSGKVLDPGLVSHISQAEIHYLRSRFTFADEPAEPEVPVQISHDTQDIYIGGTLLLRYTSNGQLSGVQEESQYQQLKPLAEQSLRNSETFYESLTIDGKTYEGHFYPENNQVNIVLTDITPIIRYKEKLHESTLRSYKDVIEVLSNNKVDICIAHEELLQQLGVFVGEMEVVNKGDVAASRAFVTEYLPEDIDTRRLMQVKLAVSEGVTNLIKHADGGKVSVYKKHGTLQIYITDQGSGIPLHELPKTILVSGYSSKRSLGRGFALIHSSADHVSLHTHDQGTSLLIEFEMFSSQSDSDMKSILAGPNVSTSRKGKAAFSI